MTSLSVDGCWEKVLKNRKIIDHLEFFVTPNKRGARGKGWKLEEVVTKEVGEEVSPFKVNMGTMACYIPLFGEEEEGEVGENWEELANFLGFLVESLGEEMERNKLQGSEVCVFCFSFWFCLYYLRLISFTINDNNDDYRLILSLLTPGGQCCSELFANTPMSPFTR